MESHHGHLRYELNGEWWQDAGMVGFVPARPSFRPDLSAFPESPVVEVAVTDVQPLERHLSHGVFSDKRRVVSILRGFREDAAIPPVELLRLRDHGLYRFSLYHGGHRFYCAIAAGFSHVPAVDVTERPPVQIDMDIEQ
jgi:hypothetical protein